MIAFVASAFALDVPTVDAQLWHLPMDADRTLWTDQSRLAPGFSARIGANYVKQPLVYVYDDTGERVPVIDDVVGVDAIAAYTFWRIRAGVDVPFYPVATGDEAAGGGLGDVALDAKATLLDGDAFGLALDGRAALPTATTGLPLDPDGLGWDAALVVDGQAGPVLLAANLGAHGGPAATVGTTELGESLVARLGAGWAITDGAGLSLDVAGRASLSDLADGATRPVEVLLGGWGRLGGGLTLRGGVGRGLFGGIGSPAARAVVALAWETPPKQHAAAQPAVPTRRDRDEADFLDVPGDRTLPPGIVHVRVRGPDEQPLDATWSFNNAASGPIRAGRGGARVPPGPWSILISAPGYGTKAFAIDVDTGMTTTLDAQLFPPRVRLDGDRIELIEPLGWKGATLVPECRPVIDEIVATLRAHPEIVGVRIEGHTASMGDPDAELTLSGARAQAVFEALVAAGLDEDRFVVAGYGSTRPLDPATPAKNDRIELVVTQRK